MTSTPPPPRRIHTPPTPLHGSRFDNYEPYSPRRSSRVAAQQTTKGTPSPRFNSSPLKNSAASSTPPATIRNPRTRTSNQAFSPPSSPNSPSKRVHIVSPKDSSKRARTARHSRGSPLPASDSDTDILPEKEPHRRTSSKETFGMLNTPAKTPRKRKDANLNGTARLLFGDNEGLLAPTPRKNRKAKLDPFAILEDDVVRVESNDIQIYTDSKERVPSLDDDESNPFLTKNASKPSARSKSKKKSARDSQIEEAVKNDEGVVYVFRGKKVFRKFDDGTNQDAEEDDDNLSDMDIRRKAGGAATRPFLRSSIKPRLLFPSEEQRREREAGDEADEEALTDIEMPKPSDSVTPTKQRFQVVTPPTTVKAKRTAAVSNDVPDDIAQLQDEMAKSPGSIATTSSQTKKRRGPFDAFQRKKTAGSSASSAVKGTKREGSPMIGDTASKRTRSGVFS